MRIIINIGYIVGVGLLFLSSCTKEVAFEQKEIEHRLVVNGLIEPDSLITIRISGTVSILEDEAPLIEDAVVKLSIDGSFAETLQYQGTGMYSSTTRAIPGRAYAIEVSAPGYPDVRGIDTLPGAVPILECSKERGNTHDEYGDPHTDVEMVFRDPPGTDFYEFMFLTQHSKWEDQPYHIVFQFMVHIADPVLKRDSELEYDPFTYVFSDELFEGQKYRMENKFEASATSGSFIEPIIPKKDSYNEYQYIVLRHVSRAYYNYRKAWIRHSNNQQIGNFVDDPLYILTVGSPEPMFTNIEGGYGIFAAYNTSYYSIER